MKKAIFIISGLFFLISFARSQNEAADVRQGNRLYKSKKYNDAEISYREGIKKKSQSFEANYNLGNAFYRQKKLDKAINQFYRSANYTTDNERKAAAYHNLGNAYFNKKDYENSINAYKSALKLNPKDNQTRYNLALAQKFRNKQKKEQKKKQQQKQKQQPQPQKQQQQQQKKPENKISKENAKQLLDAAMQDEKEVQKRVKENQQKQMKKTPVDKDW